MFDLYGPLVTRRRTKNKYGSNVLTTSYSRASESNGRYRKGLSKFSYLGVPYSGNLGNMAPVRHKLRGRNANRGNGYSRKRRVGPRKSMPKKKRRNIRKKRKRVAKQQIWDGKSSVRMPTRVHKKWLNRIERALGCKIKFIKNQTGRISTGSVISTGTGTSHGIMASTFITHYDIQSIESMVSKVNINTPAPTSGLYLQKMSCDLTLANMENNDAVVWIYSLCLRNDVGGQGLNPVDDWKQGIIDEGGVAADYLYPYSTPYQSKKFCERWKVLRVQKFTLSSGAQHVHHVNCSPFHKVNRERYLNTGGLGTGGAPYGINYLTSCTMVVCLGSLVNDHTLANRGNVTFGQVNVDYAAVWRYQSIGTTDDQTDYIRNISFPTVTEPNAYLVEEKTGAILGEDNA